MISKPKGLGVFNWKRLIGTVSILLLMNGILAWFNTPQEEDPQLAPRDGIVTVIYPGAPPVDLERLVAKPIEDELAQVEAIKSTSTRLRTDYAFVQIKLKDTYTSDAETSGAWSKVQDALDRAAKKLPESAWKPELNKEIYDQHAVLLSLSGDVDRLTLLDLSRALKDRLQSVAAVKKVEAVSTPGEQLSIIFIKEKLTQHGVSLENLVRQLRGGNAAVPSGYVRVDTMRVGVLTNSFYRSSEELKRFPVLLKSGESLPLSEVATIERSPMTPTIESMHHNGKTAMALGVVAQHNVNLKQFGERVRKAIKEFETRPDFKASGIKIEEVSFQPHYVEERIFEIGLDLMKAIFLVGGVLMLMLGVRVGSIVAIQVPVVTAIAFGIFSYRGGVLNQISIAAFILAIGLLVDNVVVVVDGIQEKLDRGLSPLEAGEQTRKEYLIPLAAGTLTTIAAFMPILLARGTVADFTRDIGIVATVALLCSYLFCILVTPILASALLKKGKARQWTFVEPLGAKLGSLVARFPRAIIVIAFIAVATAVFSFRFVKKQFFPFADRDLVIVDVQLQEGTHFKATTEVAVRLEEEIKKDPRVISITRFVGRGVPPFYYNLPRDANSPHIAQFIVRTHNNEESKAFKRENEDKLQQLVPFGLVMVKEIAQGPVIKAPIEVRITSHDPAKIQLATEATLSALRGAKHIAKVRSTMGTGMMAYRLNVNDSATGIFGITRAEVSAAILAMTRGLPVTTFRGGEEPYAIQLMSKRGEESDLAYLQSGYLATTRTENLSIATLTNPDVEFTPSVIEHRDRVPVVYVYGEIARGSSENQATEEARQRVATIKPVDGVKVEMGGANAESADANKAIFLALPIGLFLLLMSLMFEFDSFRRVGIILTTIPLCAVGAVPGLILSGSTFGFMTLLGFFTLAGTVIHNGIFLIDYIDHRIHDGVPMDEAITEGIQRRTRPIILTAVATIVELLPMTLSKSTLWPPFAWAIISGLSVSTLMTLLVIPSIYRLAFRHTPRTHKPPQDVVMALLLAAVLAMAVSTTAYAVENPESAPANISTPIALKDLLEKAKGSPDAAFSESEGEKARQQAKAIWRSIFIPKVIGYGMYSHMASDVGLVNPLAGVKIPPQLGIPTGNLFPSSKDSLYGRVEVNQTLLDVSHQLFVSPAASHMAEAATHKAAIDLRDHQKKAVTFYLQAIGLRAKRLALEDYVKNLQIRRTEIQRLYELGGVSESDLLKVKLGIDDAKQGIREIQEKEEFLETILGQTIGQKGRLMAVDLPREIPTAKPGEAKGLNEREELMALENQRASAELQAKAAYTFLLPKLEGYAGMTYFRQTFLTQNNWGDIGLRLTWPIFDGAIGFARAAAANAEQNGLEARKRSVELALDAETVSARRSLDLKRQEYQERLQAVADAQRASDLDFKRLRKGKVTVNNLIDAEDTLKDRKEKASQSQVGWYGEWFRYLSAAGLELKTP